MPSPNSRRIGEDPFWSTRLTTMKQSQLNPAPPVLQAELAKPEFSKSLTRSQGREPPSPLEVSAEWPLECPSAPRIPFVASFDASDDLPDLTFSSSSSSFYDLRSPSSFSHPEHSALSDSAARMVKPVVVGLGLDMTGTCAFGGYGLVGFASAVPDTSSGTNFGCGDGPSGTFLKELEGHYLDDTTDAHISTFSSSSTIKDLRNFAKSKGEAQASMPTVETTSTTVSPTSTLSPSRFRVPASARIPIELSYRSPARISSWCQLVSSPAISPSPLPRRAPLSASLAASDSNATIKECDSTVASSTCPASAFSTYSRHSSARHTLDRPHSKGLGRSASTSGTSFTTKCPTDIPKDNYVETERGRRFQRPVSVVGVCRSLDGQLTDSNMTRVRSRPGTTTTSLPRTTSFVPHLDVSQKPKITRPTSSLSVSSKRPSFGKATQVTSSRPMSALGICTTDTLGLSNGNCGSVSTSRSLVQRNRTVSSSSHLSENIGKNDGRRSSIFGVPRDNDHQRLSLGRSKSGSVVRTATAAKTRTISSSSHLSENVIPSSSRSSASQTSSVSEKGLCLSDVVERGRKPQRKALPLTRDLSASTLASTTKQNPSGMDVSLRKKMGNMSGGRSGNGNGDGTSAITGPGIGLKRTTSLVHQGGGKVRRGSSAPMTAATTNPIRWR